MKITSIIIGGSAVIAGTHVEPHVEPHSKDIRTVAGYCAQREGHNLNEDSGILNFAWDKKLISAVATAMGDELYISEANEICSLLDKYIFYDNMGMEFVEERMKNKFDILDFVNGIILMKTNARCVRGICSPISVARKHRLSSRDISWVRALCEPRRHRKALIEQCQAIHTLTTPPH